MTAQPVEIPNAPGAPDVRALATGAAVAAAGLIPSPHPLVVAPGPMGAPEAGSPVYVATFTGTRSGEVLVALDHAVTAALGGSGVGVEIEDAVRPALEAAAQSLGPCVLGPVRVASLDEVATAVSGTELVALLGNGTPTAWLGLTLRVEHVAATAPAQHPGVRAGDGTATTGASTGAAGPAVPVSGNSFGLHLLRGVEMTLSVEIGRARMTVRDLLQLAPGSVVELDRAAGAPADLLVNGRLIARGEVVVVDEDFGLRITELVQPAGEAPA